MQNIDQSNYDPNPLKIRTPAALFSKQLNRSPPAPSHSRHQSQTTSLHHCENHRQKQALFYFSSDNQCMYFCEKCAITLASQGHTICKLQNEGTRAQSPINSVQTAHSRSKKSLSYSRNRESEMQAFLTSLYEIRNAIGTSKQSINQKLMESEQFYGEQIQQVQNYFSLIIKSLELEKHKCYNHILKERQNAEENIREIHGQLNKIDEEVTKIAVDIEDNIDTVYSIEDKMYQLVLRQYRQQEDDFKKMLGELLVTPIEMRRIQFEGVPESIYNISDCVIQNSINNPQSQQYKLADSLSAEDFNYIQAVSPRQEDRDTTPYRQISQTDSLKFSFEGERRRANHRPLKESNLDLQQ